MELLDPDESFRPALEDEFGAENILIVKDAWGGQPIRRWYKKWKAPKGKDIAAQPDLYDSLMQKVELAMATEEIQSITFLWMQGERDAREELGEVYEKSLKGLYKQLQKDLGEKNINMVIGRLSDFDMNNERYPHWTMVRDIHQKLGESKEKFSWVDTDDLNDGIGIQGTPVENDLHYSEKGYKVFGERLAEEAIKLIKN